MFVSNTNDFPIYDTSVYIDMWNPDGKQSEIATLFNQKRSDIGKMMPQEERIFALSSDKISMNKNDPRVAFDFMVRTLRGSSRHEVRFILTNNVWERAMKATFSSTGELLSSEASDNYPRTSTGEPLWWRGYPIELYK